MIDPDTPADILSPAFSELCDRVAHSVLSLIPQLFQHGRASQGVVFLLQLLEAEALSPAIFRSLPEVFQLFQGQIIVDISLGKEDQVFAGDIELDLNK